MSHQWRQMMDAMRLSVRISKQRGRQALYGMEAACPPSSSADGIPFVLTRSVAERLRALGWAPVHLQALPVVVCHQLMEHKIPYDSSLFIDLKAGRYHSLGDPSRKCSD